MMKISNCLMIVLLVFIDLPDVNATQQAKLAIKHLQEVMDQYHNRFPVYDDVSAAGNHFYAFAKIPNQFAAVEINGSFTGEVKSGATAIRCQFTNTNGTNFGGYYFQNGVLPPGQLVPVPNFGDVANAGIDLSGATKLRFWARGAKGGEKIEFFMGGVGRNPFTGQPEKLYPDSTPRKPQIGTLFVLMNEWQEFTIDLAGLDLSYVLGGFAWVANAPNNPHGAVFYLDDIEYELGPERLNKRLNEPRFLRSFVTEPFQVQAPPVDDFDLVFRNLAFSYDNALVLLAFLADNTTDSLRRAKLIGDAFVYAAQHDRTYDDGRIRTAYAAGDIALPPGWLANGRTGTVPISGFYKEAEQEFVEVEQDNVDVGNNAWPMLALLALFQRTAEAKYLDAARDIGEFIRTFKNTMGQYQGFQGGLEDPEKSTPLPREWASTEHNLDIFAAFSTMFKLTGHGSWKSDAQHAAEFIDAMFDANTGCNLAGTHDPSTLNMTAGMLPLDTQSWGVLARQLLDNLHPKLMNCAQQNHLTTSDGFKGFDFNEDKDGVWFEGTAQMVVALKMLGQLDPAQEFLKEIRRAQGLPPFGDGKGIVAASHNGVSTNFGFELFRRLHIADTAWHVFAENNFNPFYDFAGKPTPLNAIIMPLLLTGESVE